MHSRLWEVSIPQAPPGYKSGFIGIIGRPNVGINLDERAGGAKIAITSPVDDTESFAGILTTPSAQLILSIRQEFINRTTVGVRAGAKCPNCD